MKDRKMMNLLDEKMSAVGSDVALVTFDGEQVVRVIKDKTIVEDDEPTYAKLTTSDFGDGIIEVKVLSRLLPDAPDHARGFIGIAFRIAPDDSTFESLYIRPTNGRSDVQLRRNRSTQYFAYPDFKYMHSRATNPGEYESYADMTLNERIAVKIIVKGRKAKLHLHNQEQPVLVVNDLKHGSDNSGQVGLWVDIGTEGFFKDLTISPY